jgi:hypothetical protein
MPQNRNITDGGLILSTTSTQTATLTNVELLDNKTPAKLHLVDAEIKTLHTNQRQAVGIRQGLPTKSTETAPLHNHTVTGSNSYELVLGLHAPAGTGPWHLTDITVTYRIGAVLQTQTFSHNLTICSTNQNTCKPAGSATVTAAPHSTCTSGTTSWASGQPERAWLATNVSSTWQGSSGTISLSTTRTAGYSVSTSADFSVTVNDVFISERATFGVSLTHQYSTSSTWQYALTVPPNAPTERATVYVYAWKQPATTKVQQKNCNTKYTYGTVYAPDAATDPHRDYCIAVEPYPGRPDLGPTCHSGEG